MTEQPHPHPVPTQPAPTGAPAVATGPARTSAPGRTRRWLAGAMLVTVGLVAGSGTTYAFTSTPPPDLPATVSDSGREAGPMGGPREGSGAVDGTQPDQQTDGTTTDGEPT